MRAAAQRRAGRYGAAVAAGLRRAGGAPGRCTTPLTAWTLTQLRDPRLRPALRPPRRGHRGRRGRWGRFGPNWVLRCVAFFWDLGSLGQQSAITSGVQMGWNSMGLTDVYLCMRGAPLVSTNQGSTRVVDVHGHPRNSAIPRILPRRFAAAPARAPHSSTPRRTQLRPPWPLQHGVGLRRRACARPGRRIRPGPGSRQLAPPSTALRPLAAQPGGVPRAVALPWSRFSPVHTPGPSSALARQASHTARNAARAQRCHDSGGRIPVPRFGTAASPAWSASNARKVGGKASVRWRWQATGKDAPCAPAA